MNIYPIFILLAAGCLLSCNPNSQRRPINNTPQRIINPLQQNQSIRLNGQNMGNVQNIEINIILPKNNTAGLLEYTGQVNVRGSIQLDSSFRCLGGQRTPFNCQALVQNRVLEFNNCQLRGHHFQIRVSLINSPSQTKKYDINGIIVNAPQCFFTSLNSPNNRIQPHRNIYTY